MEYSKTRLLYILYKSMKLKSELEENLEKFLVFVVFLITVSFNWEFLLWFFCSLNFTRNQNNMYTLDQLPLIFCFVLLDLSAFHQKKD